MQKNLSFNVCALYTSNDQKHISSTSTSTGGGRYSPHGHSHVTLLFVDHPLLRQQLVLQVLISGSQVPDLRHVTWERRTLPLVLTPKASEKKRPAACFVQFPIELLDLCDHSRPRGAQMVQRHIHTSRMKIMNLPF